MSGGELHPTKLEELAGGGKDGDMLMPGYIPIAFKASVCAAKVFCSSLVNVFSCGIIDARPFLLIVFKRLLRAGGKLNCDSRLAFWDTVFSLGSGHS